MLFHINAGVAGFSINAFTMNAQTLKQHKTILVECCESNAHRIKHPEPLTLVETYDKQTEREFI